VNDDPLAGRQAVLPLAVGDSEEAGVPESEDGVMGTCELGKCSIGFSLHVPQSTNGV